MNCMYRCTISLLLWALLSSVVGANALHRAAQANAVGTVQQLLQAHPKWVNLVDGDSGGTPLHFAVCNGAVDVVRLLLEQGADTTVQDYAGWTPLHLVLATSNREQCARLLLQHNASVNTVDDTGATPLALICGEAPVYFSGVSATPNRTVQERMWRVYGNPDKEPLPFIAGNRALLARILLAAKADANAADDQGVTPLHRAASAQIADLATQLVKVGANPAARDRSGFTPLHVAAASGVADTALFLLGIDQQNVNVNDVGPTKETPLHLAARGNANLVPLLLAHGADPHLADSSGHTAIWYAAQFGQLAALNCLLAQDTTMLTKDNGIQEPAALETLDAGEDS